MQILVTGGAGYIGSHACVELLEAGHDVVVVDSLANSHETALERVGEITGRQPEFVRADIGDAEALARIFEAYTIDAVMHFAGLKAVGESVEQPLWYYRNNLIGTLTLCEQMRANGVRKLVFSSSATVYGEPASVPITEDFPLSATNPYGWSKLMIEQVLRDLAAADGQWQVALLRYFNPVGAHPGGRIGEDPQGTPNNLMPFITQVAAGVRDTLSVFGGDYPTQDGTGVRDYIHVVDLAKGHLAALDYVDSHGGAQAFNLGTGRGYSVLEMVNAFERVTGRKIPYRVVERRPGDIAVCYADPARAEKALKWRAERGIDDMVRDAWRWQSANPRGYAG